MVLLQRCVVEGVDRLGSERGAVDEEEDAPEPLGLQEAVHQADNGVGLAGAGRHRQQALGLALLQRCLDGPDRLFLIIAQLQVGEALLLKLLLGRLAAACQAVEQALRGVEVVQRPGQVRRLADIAEPGAGLFGELFDEGAAVAGVDERDLEMALAADGPGNGAALHLPSGQHRAGRLEAGRIALGLRDLAGDVRVLTLGLDDGDRGQAGEESIVGRLLAARGPLRDGLVTALFGPCAFLVGQLLGGGLPTGVDELLIDQDAGQRFIEGDSGAGLLGLGTHVRDGLLPVDGLSLYLRQTLLEFLLLPGQRLFGLAGQLLIGPRLGIHLFSEGHVFRLLTGRQLGQALVALQLLVGITEAGLESLNLGVQVTQVSTGILRRDKGAWFECCAQLAERLVVSSTKIPERAARSCARASPSWRSLISVVLGSPAKARSAAAPISAKIGSCSSRNPKLVC